MTAHTKGKNKRKSHDHPHKTQGFKKSKKYFSNYECFSCHKLGKFSINYPMKAERVKNMRIFLAHAFEDSDQEAKEEANEDEYSNK